MLLGYVTAVGFVSAAIAGSLYQLVTARPAAFAMPSGRLTVCLAAAISFALVGPYIVARGTIARFRTQHPRPGLVAGGIVIASIWSACSGIVMLDLALAVRQSLA